MKKLLLAALLSPICIIAQETSEPIKNKSNRLILHFKDTTGVFTQLAKEFIDRGYDIETKDRELGILKTKPGPVSKYGFEMEYKAIFRDTTITISSASFNGGYKFDVFYIPKKKGHLIGVSWLEMTNLAALLKPNFITYTEIK